MSKICIRYSLAISVAFSIALSLGATLGLAQDAVRKSTLQPAAVDTSRLVVAGGALTEILYALGIQNRIVAVDSTSQFPAEALQTKKNVGYMRALSAEGVLSMNPSAILASDKAGPPEVVKALKQSTVPYFELDDRPAPEALVARVKALAALTNVVPTGDALATSIEQDFSALNKARSLIKTPQRVLFILSLQNGRAMVGGRDTAGHSMIELAGGVNAAAAVDGFKAVTEEALLEMNPDAIVIMDRAGQASIRDQILNHNGVRTTAAGRGGRIIEMDGLYLMGFGPRAPAAARDLMRALYPTLKAELQSSIQ